MHNIIYSWYSLIPSTHTHTVHMSTTRSDNRFPPALHISHAGAVVRSAGPIQNLHENVQVKFQLIFGLQFDRKILHTQNQKKLVFKITPIVEKKLTTTYIDHILHDGLVCRHFRPLYHTDIRPDPRDEHELTPLRHLVAHLDANVPEGSIAVGKLLLELGEIRTAGSAHDLRPIELEARPLRVRLVGAHVFVRLADGVLVDGRVCGHLSAKRGGGERVWRSC